MKATTAKSPKSSHGKSGNSSSQDGRKDRRSGTGMTGTPKKGGYGGKFTWSGRDEFSRAEIGGVNHNQETVDVKDPNFEDPHDEEQEQD